MCACVCNGGGDNCADAAAAVRTDCCWGAQRHQLNGCWAGGDGGWRRVSEFRPQCIRSAAPDPGLRHGHNLLICTQRLCVCVCVSHYTYTYIMYICARRVWPQKVQHHFGFRTSSNGVVDGVVVGRVMAAGAGGFGFRSKFRRCFHTTYAYIAGTPLQPLSLHSRHSGQTLLLF